MKSTEERFWSKVDRTGDCWTWTGCLTTGGYGRFHLGNRRRVSAHRFAYELLVGPIPEGLVLDHLCRNTACVNPAHLEPVTQMENVRRGLGGRLKTHCAQGHEYTPENTKFKRTTSTTPRRRCRICVNATKRQWKRRRAKGARV